MFTLSLREGVAWAESRPRSVESEYAQCPSAKNTQETRHAPPQSTQARTHPVSLVVLCCDSETKQHHRALRHCTVCRRRCSGFSVGCEKVGFFPFVSASFRRRFVTDSDVTYLLAIASERAVSTEYVCKLATGSSAPRFLSARKLYVSWLRSTSLLPQRTTSTSSLGFTWLGRKLVVNLCVVCTDVF